MTTQKKKPKSRQTTHASKFKKLNAHLGKITFEIAASGTLAVLMLLVSTTIFIGESAGVRISVNMPENGLVNPFQIIQFTFSEPYNPEIASELITIDPIHEGFIQWVNDSTMQFIPLKPFEKNKTYRLNINPGEISTNSREVKKKQTWEFQVREARVAYLTSEDNQSILWSTNLNGDAPTQLTSKEIKIISFDTAANGEFIIFTSANEKGGIDLWRVGREGGNENMLLNCGFDRCTTPVIAPDNLRIAYSREAAGPSPDLPFGSPRIWIFDINTGATGPVYEDQQILGYNPSWSPDATRLASFDGLSDFIYLIDFLTGNQLLFASNTGGPITWSPDSTKFLYTTYEQTENGGRTQVKLADLSINEAITFIGEKDSYDYSYYAIAWSPREDRAALSMRASRDQLTQVLWVFDPTLLDGIIVAGDPEYTYNSPQWDSWGNALLFQQFKLRGQYKPEIGVWQEGSNQYIVLAEGITPQWLP
jgi:Tol biopolymer transport system component